MDRVEAHVARAVSAPSLPARDGLAEVQRLRMISAMVDAACSRGAAHVTVNEVVTRAGVSRRTFYELFADSEDCLRAALEHALACARGYVRETYDPQASWLVRMRAGLAAILSFLDDEPLMGRLLIVEALCVRHEVLARRSAALAAMIGEIDSARSGARGGGQLSPLTAEGLAGAVVSVLHSRMLAERQEPLLDLHSPLMAMIALPYLGPAAARRELSRPAPAYSRGDRPQAVSKQLNGLPMRVTYRTARVLEALALQPGASNRQIGGLSGVSDQGQISKLLRRLARLGLVQNGSNGNSAARGAPNAWTLTPRGVEVQQAMSLPRHSPKPGRLAGPSPMGAPGFEPGTSRV